MPTTRKQVESNLGQVSSEQIGRCTRVYDFQLRANIYKVLSESDDLTEYRVTYDKQHGFCCTCRSGQNGFSNVKHPSGVCKHVRWSIACAKEEKAAMAALSLAQAQEAAKSVSIEEKWGIPAWIMRNPGPRLCGEYSY